MENKSSNSRTWIFIILLSICSKEIHGTHINANDVTDAVTTILNLTHARQLLDEAELKDKDEACDCGKNSIDCSIDLYGDKSCNCKPDFVAVEDGICRKKCRTYSCKNDGVCDIVCRCPPHVSGENCETIDQCLYYGMCGDPNSADCVYYDESTKRANCECKNESLSFDRYDRLCKECDCGEQVYCYFKEGKTICDCKEGYATVHGTCKECNCGMRSTGCSYSEDGQKVCACEVGYGQLLETCEKCDCGIGANCHLYHVTEVCDCLDGYEEYNKTCKECNCGEFGKCTLNVDGNKLCYCNPGYVSNDGKCTECYCGSYEFRCDFENDNKKCFCPKGYDDRDGYCEDIDECQAPLACPATATCVNRVGSYDCVCKEGFRTINERSDPAKFGCIDIDECQNSDACSFKNTVCLNTVGSYKCTCAVGYSSQNIYSEHNFLQCTENSNLVSKSWKTGLIIVIVLMAVVLVAVPLFLYIRRRRSYAR